MIYSLFGKPCAINLLNSYLENEEFIVLNVSFVEKIILTDDKDPFIISYNLDNENIQFLIKKADFNPVLLKTLSDLKKHIKNYKKYLIKTQEDK